MRVCKLLLLKDGKQVVVGRITLDGTKISVSPMEGYERLCTNVLQAPVTVDRGERQVLAKDEPGKWFMGLPVHYSGSYLRAEII
jgi:hypothetical protein